MSEQSFSDQAREAIRVAGALADAAAKSKSSFGDSLRRTAENMRKAGEMLQDAPTPPWEQDV